jgi:hypothetical protein
MRDLGLRKSDSLPGVVSPGGGKQGPASVRMNQKELQYPVALDCLQKAKMLSLKGMPLPRHSYRLGQVLDVGSLSGIPSTPWIILTYGRFSRDGSVTGCFSV